MIRLVEVEQIRPVRLAVLRAGRPAASVVWAGDGAARHLGAFDPASGALVGCASVFARGQLRGMAVQPEWRGAGHGHDLLAAAEQVGARWCHARVGAVGFYRGAGWLRVDGLFVHAETGIEHLLMRRPARRRRLHCGRRWRGRGRADP